MTTNTFEQHIPEYIPKEVEIIKETQTNGTVLFKHPTGSEIETHDIDLYSLTYGWLSQIQSLIDMLDDEAYGSFGSILEILISKAEMELDEVFSFIDQSIGHIEIEIVSRKSWPYRTDRIVQVSVKPPKAA